MASIFTFLLFLSYTGLVVQALSMQITRETGKPEDELLLQKDTDECPRVGSSFIPGCGAYLTVILRNRADGRVGENQAIFRKIEQNNCFIIQHIDNKAQVYSRKTGGDLICRKKFKLVTFSRADRLE